MTVTEKLLKLYLPENMVIGKTLKRLKPKNNRMKILKHWTDDGISIMIKLRNHCVNDNSESTALRRQRERGRDN